MSYFFAENNLIENRKVIIAGNEAHHLLHARRIRVGETIKLQGPDGKRFTALVTDADRRTVTVRTDKEIRVPREPHIHIHLFQAYTKEKTVDVILQKSTELGVEEIHFFQSKNSPQQLSSPKMERIRRWESIVIESAKQCDRAVWPKLDIIEGEEQLESRISMMNHFYIVDAKGKKSLSHMVSEIPRLLGLSIGICIGPEGGLSETELDFFSRSSNAVMTHLGQRTLRASTAAPVATSIIQSILGDMQ